jgi:hypothetical protein
LECGGSQKVILDAILNTDEADSLKDEKKNELMAEEEQAKKAEETERKELERMRKIREENRPGTRLNILALDSRSNQAQTGVYGTQGHSEPEG